VTRREEIGDVSDDRHEIRRDDALIRDGHGCCYRRKLAAIRRMRWFAGALAPPFTAVLDA
jgi:hypothetical protein